MYKRQQLAKSLGTHGLTEIEALLREIEEDPRDVRGVVRVLFLCGSFGRVYPTAAPLCEQLLRRYLGRHPRLSVAVGAAAVEIGRAPGDVGVPFRDEILVQLLSEPGDAGDAEAVIGWVLNALLDNAIALGDRLKAAVSAIADGSAPDSDVIRDKARKLLGRSQ